MACVTLKRPLEFDPIYNSSGSSSSCTPRPQKRRRCLPMCIPASQVNTSHSPSLSASAFAALPHTTCAAAASSPFTDATPALLQSDIALYVRQEIRRLRRRRLLHTCSQSPPGTGSRSTMDMEAGACSNSSFPPLSTNPNLTTSPSNKDKPLFSFKQVVHLCEQLLRERDGKVREEYERVLQQRKAEQYACFMRFTADHLHPTQDNIRPTYLS